ncbi:MAG: hypothetical protein Q8Q67_00310 [bacterium]|nr:hypothetical protein [bacterium]
MDSLPYEVKKKIIKSGNIIEIFEYEKSYWVGWPQYRKIHRPEFKHIRLESEQIKIREDNVKRARQKITRLINSNPQLKTFLTLTFKDEILDLKTANKYFDRFIKRISYGQNDFQYLAVPEFQPQSKRVHYHLVSNYPLPEFETGDKRKEYERWFADKYWKNGFINFRPINNAKNIGIYISKYLSKEMFDPRYFKKRKFFYSKNLNQPEIIDYPDEVDNFLDFFSPDSLDLIKEREFYSDRLGQIKETIYKINEINNEELDKIIKNNKSEKTTKNKELNIDDIVF